MSAWKIKRKSWGAILRVARQMSVFYTINLIHLTAIPWHFNTLGEEGERSGGGKIGKKEFYEGESERKKCHNIAHYFALKRHKQTTATG